MKSYCDQKLTECHRTERQSHTNTTPCLQTPYAPALALSDFALSSKVKMTMKSLHFEVLQESKQPESVIKDTHEREPTELLQKEGSPVG